jgi:phosphoribosylamine-glycine ligase
VIEEFLEGEEASHLMADGRNVPPLATSQGLGWRRRRRRQRAEYGGMGASLTRPRSLTTPCTGASWTR